jgi:hypothetical protein
MLAEWWGLRNGRCEVSAPPSISPATEAIIDHLRAFEMIGDLDQRACGDDLDIRARPGRLASAGRRTDQALLAGISADRGRQHARDRRDRPIETQFTEHGEARKCVGGNGADRRHEAKRNRKIIVGALLRKVGRREVDGDSTRRQR